jgi:DNA sulfur modification protein DndD
MILEQLTLRNFCLFAGEQAFDLRPGRRDGRHLPIVLFGGINGGGKTTLLDAIQLALYGVRARCSKRSQMSYDDFLRESIHHGAPASRAGARVAVVSLRHRWRGTSLRRWRLKLHECERTLHKFCQERMDEEFNNCGTIWQRVAASGTILRPWQCLASLAMSGKSGNVWQVWQCLASLAMSGKSGMK